MTAIYAVANTPPYLFKHLRRLSEVERLGKRIEPAALAAILSEILAQPNRTPTDVARGYALLVAITFRDYTEWRRIADALNLAVLDWGESFRRLMKSNAAPTVVTELGQRAASRTTVRQTREGGVVEIDAYNRPPTIIPVDR
jgi:hypothetical protein